jgi:Ankyrin repeats (3 copies)
MENRQTGIFRLCVIIGFFSISIFFLNNNKKKYITETSIDILNFKIDSLAHLSLNQAYTTMEPLFLSHDIDLIVKTIHQFQYEFTYNFVEKIIQDEKLCLSHEEKLKILYGIIAHYGAKKNSQYDLLDLLLKYPALQTQTPALLVLAQSKYSDNIALFIAWGKERQKNGVPNLLSSYADTAFTNAIESNDYATVEMLFSKKVRISQTKASALLWYIVEHNKQSELISLLVHHAQADVNSVNKGKTLLIAAVEKNNIDIIHILLDEGAIVDRTIEGENKTALQVAIINKCYSVEQLLREYGA